MRKPNTKCKNNNTIWFKVWEKKQGTKIHNNYGCDPCRTVCRLHISCFKSNWRRAWSSGSRICTTLRRYAAWHEWWSRRTMGFWDTTFHILILKCKVVRISFVFDDHVVEYNTCLHDHSQLSFMHVASRPRTMANQDCRTPNALSTSFLTASWRSVKNLPFALCRKVAHRG